MIRKIVIEKFRSIEYLELELNPLTILVGKNNSGKSNIIDALRVACEEGVKFESKGNMDCFCFEKDKENDFNVQLFFEDGETEQLKGKPKKNRKISLDNYGVLYISAEFDVKDPAASKEVKSELTKLFELVAGNINEAEEMLQKKLDEVLAEDIISQAKEAINEYLNDWDDIKLDIKPQHPALKKIIDYFNISIIESGVSKGAESLGSGLKRSIIAAILHGYAHVKTQNYSKKLFLLFEEPELFLHPWQLMQLRKDLKELSSNGHIIVTTTHSPVFAALESTEDWLSVKRITKCEDLTKIHSFENITLDKFSDTESNEYNPLKYAIMLNRERSQLFFCEKIIIVEGWSDKILLENLILEGKIKGKNFYIMEATGKYNILNWINILKNLSFKILIIYDRDNKEKKNTDLNNEIDGLKDKDNIEVYPIDPQLEEFIMTDENFKNYDVERKDLKPALLIHYYKEGRLIEKKLKEIIDRCNDFFSN